MFCFLVKIFSIGVLHFTLGVALYYGRVKEVFPVLRSDLVVFIMPAILAFVGYFLITWVNVLSTHRLIIRLFLVSVIALCALAISGICIAIFAFNKYGT